MKILTVSLCLLLFIGTLFCTVVLAQAANQPTQQQQITANTVALAQITADQQYRLEMAKIVIPALVTLAGTLFLAWLNRKTTAAVKDVKTEQVVAKAERQAVSDKIDTVAASVNGVNTALVQATGQAAFAQGAASVTSPGAAQATLTLAEHAALDVLAVAADRAKTVLSDAGAKLPDQPPKE